MRNILKDLYHDDPLLLGTISSLDDPQCEEERKIVT